MKTPFHQKLAFICYPTSQSSSLFYLIGLRSLYRSFLFAKPSNIQLLKPFVRVTCQRRENNDSRFSAVNIRARNQGWSGTRWALKRAPDQRVAFLTRQIWYLDGQAILTVEKFTTCDARNYEWLKHNNNKRIIGIVAVNSHIILSFVIESVMNNLGTQKQLRTKSWTNFQVELFCFHFLLKGV